MLISCGLNINSIECHFEAGPEFQQGSSWVAKGQGLINRGPWHSNTCRNELSTPQVIKPINLAGLTAWSVHIPEEVRRDMDKMAPMLRVLGYNTSAYPPNYGTPDVDVLKRSQLIALNSEYWKLQELKVLNKTNINNLYYVNGGAH